MRALAAVCVAAGLLLSPPAIAAVQHSSADLSCAGAGFNVETTFDPALPANRKWLRQRIEVRAAPSAPTITLPLAAPGLRGRPLQGFVVSWACIPGGSTAYVLLAYSCARADLGGPCHGEREWFRIIDRRGRPLDRGYTPQDRRYATLYRQLGIDHAMAEGVQLTAVTGE